jgi:hypothetical protein
MGYCNWSVHNTIEMNFSELWALELCQDGNGNHCMKHHSSQLQMDQKTKKQKKTKCDGLQVLWRSPKLGY